MDKKVNLLNYFFSIGIILLIVVFLLILMNISRFVLSDVTPIGAHVMQTKNLLEDISEVDEAISENKTDNIVILNEERRGEIFDFDEGYKITDIGYINVNENKTIVTMFFDSNIGDINKSLYYVEIKDFTNLRKGETIIYTDPFSGNVNRAKYSSIRPNDELIILIAEENSVIEASYDEVLGRFLYEAN